MEPLFLHIMTFPSSISFNVFHTSSESGRTHSFQRPPSIFSPPYLNQASPSTCNFQHCLYLLKSYFFSRLGKEAIFSCLARCKLSISPLNFQRSNMLISFLFLSHVLLSLVTYILVSLSLSDFKFLGTVMIIIVIITITPISSYHIPALCKAYNFISATL